MNLPANKLVFVGVMGAGKTTAVRAISDVEPVSTEMPLSEHSSADKTETTVAMDYSSIALDDGELLHVYGVPGQRYLDFMWPLVADGALGVVVLVSAGTPDAVQTTLGLLQDFARIAPQASLAVGVTRTDDHPGFLLPEFRDALFAAGMHLPVLRVDARSATQVTFLVKALLSYRLAQQRQAD
ncbi:GTPase [Stenotrophomonas sp.]|uniref:GTP-binding protein n=1 Tax=Stenotrophomonas sp. TaxID=69392 RepID=UPI00289DD4E6|nr:GTPase [Stenotrophomonas sp.]